MRCRASRRLLSKLPKPDFIRAAKKAGVKFTLGTNNADANLGRNEYGLQMIRECKLAWTDFWMPRPAGQKRIERHAGQTSAAAGAVGR